MTTAIVRTALMRAVEAFETRETLTSATLACTAHSAIVSAVSGASLLIAGLADPPRPALAHSISANPVIAAFRRGTRAFHVLTGSTRIA